MTDTLAPDPIDLALQLELVLTRLGAAGQAGIEAFNELMASRGESADFDAGVDLLDAWIGNDLDA